MFVDNCFVNYFQVNVSFLVDIFLTCGGLNKGMCLMEGICPELLIIDGPECTADAPQCCELVINKRRFNN